MSRLDTAARIEALTGVSPAAREAARALLLNEPFGDGLQPTLVRDEYGAIALYWNELRVRVTPRGRFHLMTASAPVRSLERTPTELAILAASALRSDA